MLSLQDMVLCAASDDARLRPAIGNGGWYLLEPPLVRINPKTPGVDWPDSERPLSEWVLLRAYSTVDACEAARANRRADSEENYRANKKAGDDFPPSLREFLVNISLAGMSAANSALCIATNDPWRK
jgi:hypothetical protein